MGEVTIEKIPVMRAMTMSQLCFYLNCSESYFRHFKSENKDTNSDFITVIAEIERVVYNQKFQGASANLLNANIIARDLGLIDKSDLTTNGESINLANAQKAYIASLPNATDTEATESI